MYSKLIENLTNIHIHLFKISNSAQTTTSDSINPFNLFNVKTGGSSRDVNESVMDQSDQDLDQSDQVLDQIDSIETFSSTGNIDAFLKQYQVIFKPKAKFSETLKNRVDIIAKNHDMNEEEKKNS